MIREGKLCKKSNEKRLQNTAPHSCRLPDSGSLMSAVINTFFFYEANTLQSISTNALYQIKVSEVTLGLPTVLR